LVIVLATKSLIIIGVDLAGLATGAYVQMNSYTTKIFEMQEKPCGVFVSWKRKDIHKRSHQEWRKQNVAGSFQFSHGWTMGNRYDRLKHGLPFGAKPN
jgi:hypothetical protein